MTDVIDIRSTDNGLNEMAAKMREARLAGDPAAQPKRETLAERIARFKAAEAGPPASWDD